MKKILLIAPFSDPFDTGEAWSNFQWVKGISKSTSTTVLTWRKGSEDRGLKNHLADAEIIEWTEPKYLSYFKNFNSMAKPGYYLFYSKARKWIRNQLNHGRRWDIAHQLSPLAMRYPSPLCKLGIPYVIGPLAGSVQIPKAFEKSMSAMPWYTRLRGIDSLRFRFDGMLRKSYEDASLVLGVAPYVNDLLSSMSIRRFEVMNETGVIGPVPCADQGALSPVVRGNAGFRILSVGRIVRTKGIRDLIRALGKLRHIEGLVADVIGDGEDMNYVRNLARELKLDDIIRFHGRIPREDVAKYYAAADVFVFPSFKEPSGNVVLESMSYGLPLIVWDGGGPGYTVQESFGIKIKAESEAAYAEKLAEAISSLHGSPERLQQMRIAALKEVDSKYVWDDKIRRLIELYDIIL